MTAAQSVPSAPDLKTFRVQWKTCAVTSGYRTYEKTTLAASMDDAIRAVTRRDGQIDHAEKAHPDFPGAVAFVMLEGEHVFVGGNVTPLD